MLVRYTVTGEVKELSILKVNARNTYLLIGINTPKDNQTGGWALNKNDLLKKTLFNTLVNTACYEIKKMWKFVTSYCQIDK